MILGSGRAHCSPSRETDKCRRRVNVAIGPVWMRRRGHRKEAQARAEEG